MLLKDFVGLYVASRDVSAEYTRQLAWSVERIERFIGEPPALKTLSDDLLNRWIAATIESGLSRRTVRSQRNNILTLWKDAAEKRLIDSRPVCVRPVKCPRLVPDASPPSQLVRVLQAAQMLRGRLPFSRVDRRLFWIAFISAAWESDLRLGDMLRLERSHISNGLLSLAQHKTGWPIIRPLSAECVAAIDAIFPPARERIFGDALSRGAIQIGMRRLLASVGLKGGAMAYLGHRTPGLAYQYYVDPRLAGGAKISPPPLDSPEND